MAIDMCLRFFTLLIMLFTVFVTQVSAVEDHDEESFSFVVFGHVYGKSGEVMSFHFEEIKSEIEELQPDLIFLTGDMIGGQRHTLHVNGELIQRDWDLLDSALEKFGVPVYRVPGNHDLHDPVTRDIYFSRYGELPQVVTFRNSRFVLLNSAFVPEGDQPEPVQQRSKHTSMERLATKQIDFIREEFSRDKPCEHIFLFLHHNLWWNASWWRDVHPLLVGRNVRAVFGGDLWPTKFSHMERDGISYIHSAMEGLPSVGIRRNLESSKLLSQQFDNYLYVTVDGPDFTISVKTLGAMSLGKFSPQEWRAVNEYDKPYKVKLFHIWNILKRSTLFEALIVVVCGVFVCGVIIGYMLKYIRTR